MKIVNFNDFLSYPCGTIFSYSESDVLYCKGETIYSDYEVIDYMVRPLDDTSERPGVFELWEEFVIYDEEDLINMGV